MFIELVELLRCIRAHDESWLVASIDVLRERCIHSGRLGCPICKAEYPVIEGVVDFSAASVSPALSSRSDDPEGVALRAGAFLGLAEASGTVILGGSWAAGAAALQRTTDVRVFAANSGIEDEAGAIGRILVSEAFPFAVASCAGVALDDRFHHSLYGSAVRVIRPGGRMVGPASVPCPAALTLLAEDAESWVAEKSPEVTPLRRGNR